jgi:ribonuclease HII
MKEVQEIDWLFYEHTAQEKGYKLVCGVDEAGRGPLAGPVCAAAVILPDDCIIPGLNDSKKLTEKKREALFPIICEKAMAYGIGFASAEEIDEINILQATFLAMSRAIDQLSLKPDWVMVDGNRMPPISYPGETVVKGDGKSASIAAASVLAKVSRDRVLRELGEAYPMYGFEKHKGYGTKAHYEAIKTYGLLPEHRRSFLKNLQEK